jgi:hypothetical protein
MADTSQTIRNFFSTAAAADFSRDFLFRVATIRTNGLIFGEDELIYVRSASLPGRNINNVDVKYMGLSFNVPGGVTYPNSGAYSLEFYCDQNSLLRERLMTESRSVFDDTSSTGDYNTPGPENYVILYQLDKQLTPVTKYVLYGTSIRDVGDISYEIADGTGNYKTFTTTFAYHYFTNEIPPDSQTGTTSQAFPNITQGL